MALVVNPDRTEAVLASDLSVSGETFLVDDYFYEEEGGEQVKYVALMSAGSTADPEAPQVELVRTLWPDEESYVQSIATAGNRVGVLAVNDTAGTALVWIVTLDDEGAYLTDEIVEFVPEDPFADVLMNLDSGERPNFYWAVEDGNDLSVLLLSLIGTTATTSLRHSSGYARIAPGYGGLFWTSLEV